LAITRNDNFAARFNRYRSADIKTNANRSDYFSVAVERSIERTVGEITQDDNI